MSTLINNMSDLQYTIESACKKAIRNTANEAETMLHSCVNEQYYKDPGFYPNVYKRTEIFLNHVASQMLFSNLAQIYIDIEGMHYKNEFSPWQVVSWASESRHGGESYKTETTDFWTRFIDWCNKNLMNILKKNLKEQGLSIK